LDGSRAISARTTIGLGNRRIVHQFKSPRGGFLRRKYVVFHDAGYVMNCFQLIKSVLDEEYEQIPGTEKGKGRRDQNSARSVAEALPKRNEQRRI